MKSKKNKKRVPQKNEKVSRDQALQQKSHQRSKHLGSFPYKILGAILKIDKKGTQTNGPEDKKFMTMHQALYQRDDINRLYVSRKEG